MARAREPLQVISPVLVHPEWPAPARVRAVATTRVGGGSVGCYAALNLGDHVGDDYACVESNRAQLARVPGLIRDPWWLNQVHGTAVVAAGDGPPRPVADASLTAEAGLACVVLTADCLPVLFCNRAGTLVAAAHAGWRGLAGGLLEATVAALSRAGAPPPELLAWLGPAIGPAAYEIGAEVRDAFLAADPAASGCFSPTRPGHWLLDLYAAARLRLARAGVTAVWGGGFCTHAEPERFYSHRRDGVTGRQATLVWLE